MLEGDAHHRTACKNSPLKTRVWIAIVMSAVLTAGTLGYSYGQILHPTGQAPSFEVVTIKPSPPDSEGRLSIGPRADDRFVTKNATVKSLIEFAYTTDSDRQIVGLSSWMNSERYDIDAKVDDAEVAAILKLPDAKDGSVPPYAAVSACQSIQSQSSF
jgi:hypothetical protein